MKVLVQWCIHVASHDLHMIYIRHHMTCTWPSHDIVISHHMTMYMTITWPCTWHHMTITWPSHDSQVVKMSMMREWIQLLSRGISVTFNPFITLTESQMSGLHEYTHNNKNGHLQMCIKRTTPDSDSDYNLESWFNKQTFSLLPSLGTRLADFNVTHDVTHHA